MLAVPGWIRLLYPVDFIVEEGGQEVKWLDIVLRVCPSGSLSWHGANPNRNWLLGVGGRAKARFPPWLGRAQAPLEQIRARLVGRARRLQEIGVQPQDVGRHLLEDVGELMLMGYPSRFVRGVMFSLPASLACAGHLQRTFLQLLRRGSFRGDAGSRAPRQTPSGPPPPLSLKGREIGLPREPRPPPPPDFSATCWQHDPEVISAQYYVPPVGRVPIPRRLLDRA